MSRLPVCLDTEVFVREGLNFTSTMLVSFCELAERDEVQLVITDIVKREVLEKISERAKAISSTYVTARREIVRFSPESISGEIGINPIAVCAEGARRFEGYLARCKAVVVSTETLLAKPVIDAYFENKPPFERAKIKKKAEFPDAFSLAALIEWQRTQGGEVAIVSADEGFRQAVNGVAAFQAHPALADFLNWFNATLAPSHQIRREVAKRRTELQEWVAEIFPDPEVATDLGPREAVRSVRVEQVSISDSPSDFEIVSLKKTQAVLVTEIDIDARVVVEDERTYRTERSYSEFNRVYTMELEITVLFHSDTTNLEIVAIDLTHLVATQSRRRV